MTSYGKVVRKKFHSDSINSHKMSAADWRGWPDRAQGVNIRPTHRNADTRMRFIMPIREWRTLRSDDVLTKRSTEQPRATERADAPWLSNAGLSAAVLESSVAR